jgi:hypothetical protein
MEGVSGASGVRGIYTTCSSFTLPYVKHHGNLDSGFMYSKALRGICLGFPGRWEGQNL